MFMLEPCAHIIVHSSLDSIADVFLEILHALGVMRDLIHCQKALALDVEAVLSDADLCRFVPA